MQPNGVIISRSAAYVKFFFENLYRPAALFSGYRLDDHLIASGDPATVGSLYRYNRYQIGSTGGCDGRSVHGDGQIFFGEIVDRAAGADDGNPFQS